MTKARAIQQAERARDELQTTQAEAAKKIAEALQSGRPAKEWCPLSASWQLTQEIKVLR
jgi:hypothetical protein